MRITQINRIGVSAFLAHALVAGIVWAQHFEGSWGGFLLFIFDFPASLLFFLPGIGGSWIAMIFIGGVWWYLVVVGIRKLIARLGSKNQHNESS